LKEILSEEVLAGIFEISFNVDGIVDQTCFKLLGLYLQQIDMDDPEEVQRTLRAIK